MCRGVSYTEREEGMNLFWPVVPFFPLFGRVYTYNFLSFPLFLSGAIDPAATEAQKKEDGEEKMRERGRKRECGNKKSLVEKVMLQGNIILLYAPLPNKNL